MLLHSFFFFVLVLTILNNNNNKAAVSAFKVPDLATERRCPACVSFAVSMRRASWETQPSHSTQQRADRKRHLNFDSRCQDVLTEAMDVVLTRQAFVYFSPNDLPTIEKLARTGGAFDEKTGEFASSSSSDDDGGDSLLLMLYYNKSDAPKNAIGRFWSLQDLYLHRRLQLSDFQKIMTILSKNTDQSLMHFMHDEIREALGDEAEGLCYLDLFHSKNFTRDMYINAPSGEKNLRHFTPVGKAFDLNAQWLTLNILKNRTLDEAEALPWAYKLCKGKDLCGKEASSAPGFGSKKVKEYIASMFPIHPPKSTPRDFSDDPSKASGEFVLDEKVVQAAMKGRNFEERDDEKTIEYVGEDKPMLVEDY
jgi:hypothetical protein